MISSSLPSFKNIKLVPQKIHIDVSKTPPILNTNCFIKINFLKLIYLSFVSERNY